MEYFDELRDKLLSDPKVKEEYERLLQIPLGHWVYDTFDTSTSNVSFYELIHRSTLDIGLISTYLNDKEEDVESHIDVFHHLKTLSPEKNTTDLFFSVRLFFEDNNTRYEVALYNPEDNEYYATLEYSFAELLGMEVCKGSFKEATIEVIVAEILREITVYGFKEEDKVGLSSELHKRWLEYHLEEGDISPDDFE